MIAKKKKKKIGVAVDHQYKQVSIVLPIRGAQALGWILDALMDTAMHVEADDIGVGRSELKAARSLLFELSGELQKVEGA